MLPMLPMLVPQVPCVDACNEEAWDCDTTEISTSCSIPLPIVIVGDEVSAEARRFSY
jgi:hypothetical protein